VNKKELRSKLLDERLKLSQADIKSKSQTVVSLIQKDIRYQNAKTVAIYYPMQGELDVLGLLKDTNKVFCFPKIEGGSMRFYRINERTRFERSKFGVNEPVDGTLIDDIDFMVVPAIGISKSKYRIGYGKGFYDRYLSAHHIGFTMGIIYDFSEIVSFDVDAHDQPLDDYIKV
jgi:5-formyltetrahydrofolate cyclo-ligase